VGVSLAQVSLTAQPTTLTLPDGSTVPMWGYSCGAAVTSQIGTCAPLNPNAPTGTWSPVVITVPAGSNLTISLQNLLTFGPALGTPTATVPTSLVIVGQVGAGLGNTATTTLSPTHATQVATWPIAGANPPAPGDATNNPPPQGNRVQSFSTEVAEGATTALTWTAPRPGTYLLESGTHPSIQGPMGLYGIVVVTAAPVGATPGCAYPGATVGSCVVPYNSEVPLLFSEIDPVQNRKVAAAVNTTGFSETMVWSGQPNGCGNPTSATYNQCYPPAVNYTPLYYLVNGAAFNKTNAGPSLFAATAGVGTTGAPVTTGITGSVLVRMVNAGLRMHVPSIVGSQTTPPIVPTGVTAAATPGFSLVAEDGSPLPGVSRVQSEVFMAAGKTYDVMINVPAAAGSCTPVPPATACTGAPLPVFDRELSLSGNAIGRDAGMLAYIGVNGAGLPASPAFAAAVANTDTYNSVITCTATPCKAITISDPGKGVIANDVNVYGVQLLAAPTGGTVTLAADGTFVYTPNVATTSDSFSYCANGSVTAGVCSSGITATVNLGAASIELGSGITCGPSTFPSNVATTLSIKPPGILANCKDAAGYPLTVNAASVTGTLSPSGSVSVDANGGFNASVGTAGSYTFTFKAQNSQGTVSSTSATVTLTFAAPSLLSVKVIDGGDRTTPITDYRWIIEEDRTFYINPNCTGNPPPVGCPSAASGIVPTFGTNFHTSYMPVVAAGCTGPLSCESGQTLLGAPAVCDVGNGVCRTTGAQQATLDPGQVHLDPTKRYYISVLPGDAANPFIAGYASAPACTKTTGGVIDTSNPSCGHGMGGAPIACVPGAGSVVCASTGTFPPVTVLTQPSPYPPAKLSVFVFEDDFPLNGEQDGGGGIDVLSPNEPGLGGFNITLFDDAGGPGDATGQMTYDMFNMPLANALDGLIDPSTGLNACPVSKNASQTGPDSSPTASPTGITGTIVTCPKYESDGKTLSPIAGQAVVANLMIGRYGVVATPGADRIARGEEWLQTNTLDGQKAHDSFLRVGEPSFFQEYGPAGYHVSIGFANPAIINARRPFVCNGTDPNISGSTCTNTLTGTVTTERMSRTPDERLYSSGDNSSFAFTQCYVSFGDADGEDFAFTKCDANGNFTLSGLPNGDWRITVFDQWNDMLVDGLSTPVRLSGGTTNLGQIAINQWQANIYTKTFFDLNGNGTQDSNEDGLALVATNNRFRDGSYSNFNNTDLSGNAGFNEIFPLFSWYVIETDSTRYKTTGAHVVYDAGGPSDGSTCGGTTGTVCGNSSIAGMLANTAEQIPVPNNLRVPGAFYCANGDCTDASAPFVAGGTGGSTGRIDPAMVHPYGSTYGWQGFSGQNNFVEFGKKPYVPGETGGIHGEVIYASTRPFDDPSLLIHTSWTPDVPGVTVNLYKEGTAPDGSQSLTLIDSTKTSSFDDWAQGFRTDGVTPNISCPGQGTNAGINADLFFFSLYNQPQWLDVYNHGATATTPLPNNSQFKCYDGMHNWNQIQPAPYDGMYQFPSVTALNPTTGKPAGTNCTACVTNPDSTDPYRYGGNPVPQPWVNGTSSGAPMLPAGKYVVEVVVPPGYELVKEEDKNILIGDNYIAPVTQQFAGLGNIFIMPDQAAIDSEYNANNAQNSTQTLSRPTIPSHEGDTGSVETFWPCVGALRTVPDFISLFPQSQEVSPFAGASRHLCDRKEVTVTDQSASLAKFWIFSSTHVAAHFTGVITDDFTSEFDPFSPQFGEKFSPPDLPVSIKDWSGNEISRIYADHWGAYNGLTYSTWEVNPPNPTGYGPTMMVTCMNDPGPIPDPANPGQMITDPLFNPAYSQFCYEIPFMPGQTQYMDTPVTPTSAFAGAGYNNPDCAYPDLTPAVAEVDGDGVGPWVSASGTGHTLRITALGNQMVPNHSYSGPSQTAAPWNQKYIQRHYGFGGTAGTVALLGSDGVARPLTGVSWSDAVITGTVPGGLPQCTIQQQSIYRTRTGATSFGNELCGQLVITAANGKQSIDTVTVTVGGRTPTHVPASGSVQSAIDAAAPGDMIIIDPTCTTTAGPVACTTAGAVHSNAAHSELLLMWKPVRLQGVGAASSVINANTHPAGKLNDWRARVNCLFGLTLNGAPNGGDKSCAGSNWFGFNPTANNPQIDRLPLEATVGWDASLNGNLAELLQEPSLMGALEGAGITVLSKGVFFPSNPFDPTLLAGFPTGTVLFMQSNTGTYCPKSATSGLYTSNFWCNPASVDGVTIQDSSQGGGGIFVHGWGHNVQIANNRVVNNTGTLSGGISVGQGEFPPAYFGGAAALNSPPGSCQTSNVANLELPYCHDLNVNVHNNSISLDSSTGDELFSATPAGAGGISFCTGSDNYKFNYNWVCGNLSTGDGGGFGHLGFSYNGDIEHNSFLFNQSTNPTIASNGGGVIIQGAPDVDPPCGLQTDADCVPVAGSVGPSDGTGPGLVINANLIMGNQAESGSGGGLAFQQVNGSDVVSFPNGAGTTGATAGHCNNASLAGCRWNTVSATNNIIVNNVAGWDGAGVSFLDAFAVNFINNTVMSNDSTASSGVLFNTIGAPLASTGGSNCIQTGSTTASCPQPAGLVVQQNSSVLTANLAPLTVTCPAGHGTNCKSFSTPLMDNDVFWQNRSFYIGVGTLGTGTLNQQHVVALYNSFTTNQAVSQTATGQCPAASYWDIGVRGDTGPTNHGSGATLAPNFSFVGTGGYGGSNSSANPAVTSQYCNGSRVPPELGSSGYQVPPGISDATVPNPIFNLTPAATVDEGNNWINIAWGPLSLVSPSNVTLGNYTPTGASPTRNYILPSAGLAYTLAPNLDFFNTARKPGPVDAGAVEFAAGGAAAVLSVTGGPLSFGNVPTGTTSAAQTLTLHNTGTAAGTGIAVAVTAPFSRAGGTCGVALPGGGTCTITVVFSPTAVGAATGTATITANVAVAGSPVTLSGTGVAAVLSATLTPTSRNFGTVTRGNVLGPVQIFTLTNTGNVTLTGIAQGALGGTNPTEFTIIRLLSTCGPAGGGQLLGQTTLAPGAGCVVTVQFRPLTTQTTGAKSATVSVTDAAGTQTSTLTGTAN
jgi:hypothetical protein